MAGIDWKDQVHKSAGRTDNVRWYDSPIEIDDAGGLAADEVLAAREGRVGFQIQNVGSDTVYLGYDDTVRINHIALTPRYAVKLLAGEAWWVYVGEGIPVNPVHAICATGATTKLAFYELF